MEKLSDNKLKKLWQDFRNTPVNNDDTIDEDFYIWKKGTYKIDIWHWFDDNHSKGLAEGLMGY